MPKATIIKTTTTTTTTNETPDPRYWGWVVVADGKETALETWGGGPI